MSKIVTANCLIAPIDTLTIDDMMPADARRLLFAISDPDGEAGVVISRSDVISIRDALTKWIDHNAADQTEHP